MNTTIDKGTAIISLKDYDEYMKLKQGLIQVSLTSGYYCGTYKVRYDEQISKETLIKEMLENQKELEACVKRLELKNKEDMNRKDDQIMELQNRGLWDRIINKI